MGNRFKGYTHEEFVDTLPIGFFDEYELLEKYHGFYTPIKILHKPCGTITEIEPDRMIKHGVYACAQCYPKTQRVYYGECYIKDTLSCLEVNFASQVMFKDCKGVRSYPFDFGVYDEQKNLCFLIEYDGEQHFGPIEGWGGQPAFAQRVEIDRYKDQYCLDHSIPLL